MHRRRYDRGGLAEIVGTLMLVLIVVAAAVAFSLFVASYEAQLTNEERAAHNRALEALRIVNVSETGPLGLTVHLASGDVNWMNLTGYTVDGVEVQTWTYAPSGSAASSCSWPSSVAACTELAPLATATVNLSGFGTLLPSEVIDLDIFTKLANEFRFLFLPPVAVIKASILPIGSQSVPLFDASGSYEPSGGDNATIGAYTWAFEPSFREMTGTVKVTGYNDPVNESVVNLNFTTVNPATPLPPANWAKSWYDSSCGVSLCFNASGLPDDTNWSVYIDSSSLLGRNVTNDTSNPAGSLRENLANGTYSYLAFVSSPSPFDYHGPQVEVYQLSTVLPLAATYWLVSLTVEDTDGLTNTTSIVYDT